MIDSIVLIMIDTCSTDGMESMNEITAAAVTAAQADTISGLARSCAAYIVMCTYSCSFAFFVLFLASCVCVCLLE